MTHLERNAEMHTFTHPVMNAVRRSAAGAAAAGLVLAMSAAPASAHTALTSADPEEDSTVKAPSQIVLTYSEPVRLPRVIVTDASEKQVQSGEPRAVDNKVTQRLGGTLPNGEYTVAWRVVSADGHPVQDAYTFTVEGSPAKALGDAAGDSPGAGAQPPAGSPESSPANATSAEDSGTSSGWLWIGLIGLVIAGAAGAVAWLRRSAAPKS
ncbi:MULTISPECIES: copper resistance protein CopC [unclassified Spirillospora]|uniref:copper resistance CopC family protein n=1 Tax=unclassified Spirillospora TaxID=2642701 RepID=UPI00371077E7